MMRSMLLALAVLCAQEALAEIPLESIWGFDLPGTNDIAGIPLPAIMAETPGSNYAVRRREREFCIEQFRQALTAKPPADRARPAFIVPREPDYYSLRHASNRAAFRGRGEKFESLERNSFPVGDEMTLVIFSHPASYFFRLRQVEFDGNTIAVAYQYEPHATVEATVHFALIPLGKLPVGEYRVRFNQLRMEKRFEEAGFFPVEPTAQTLVSQPFNFTVWEPPSADQPDESAEVVPLETIWTYHILGGRDLRDLEPSPAGLSKEEFLRSSMLARIGQALLRAEDEAKPGFAVPGVDRAALERAHEVIVNKAEPANAVPPNEDATIVFFTYGCGPIQLDRVERNGQAIKIKYHFVQSPSMMGSPHLALIPLGKLPSGKYDVDVVQLPTEGVGREIGPERVRRVICRPFSFDVAKVIQGPP